MLQHIEAAPDNPDSLISGMRACRCGIRVYLRNGEVRYIDGNPDYLFTLLLCVAFVSQFAGLDLEGNPIAVADHCYGCTAGQGSSCGGAMGAA